METKNHIEEIIRAELVKVKTSRRQVCIKTGVSEPIICRFMQGIRGLSTESAWALLDYFGYKIVKGKATKQ
jgi:plasmid maintenance system antidote protein VapI